MAIPRTLIANLLFSSPNCTFPFPVIRAIIVRRGNTTGSNIKRIHKDNNVIGKTMEIKGKAISTTIVITDRPNTITGGRRKIEN
ncbi:MAG: hypothetical protein H8D23_04040, partial [Candidatus Brocadiales bacterium]|nr:hypothetical protein [Candidatus Brocadiales bacterium]